MGNFLLFNKNCLENDCYYGSRIDGVLSHTEFVHDRKNKTEVVARYDFLIYPREKLLSLKEKSGLVDLMCNESGMILIREIDYDDNKKEFDDADRILANAEKRFEKEITN